MLLGVTVPQAVYVKCTKMSDQTQCGEIGEVEPAAMPAGPTVNGPDAIDQHRSEAQSVSRPIQ